MTTEKARTEAILKSLGNGLVLRQATAEDADEVADLAVLVFGGGGSAWTRDVMSGRHPTMNAGDFTVVEDTSTGKVVSSLCLISQRWSYAGIEFGVGQVEGVATHPDYRRRRLIRAQFEVVHQWSAERGEKVTVVEGIPWFYRQFGYEMALENEGGRVGYAASIPPLKEGETEPYKVRPAAEADIPFITQVREQGSGRWLVSAVRDEGYWRYRLLEGAGHPPNGRVIETAGGGPVGFLLHWSRLRGGQLNISVYELSPGVSWLAVTPSVLRYVKKTGEGYAAGDDASFTTFGFWFGTEHPAYHAASSLLPRIHRPYAWYMRVPDIPDFIRHIAPVLEERLASSFAAGHTGDLKISFVKGGLRMVFEEGRLAHVEPWGSPQTDTLLDWKARDALFPGLIFLQLLFGYRSVEDLEYAFADCGARSDETRALLNVLFPKQPSLVRGIG